MNTNRKDTAYERTLKAWVKDYEATNMSPEVRKMINLATHDLYYGPALQSDCDAPPRDEYDNENEWSGYDFVKACKLIKDALSDIPSTLYLDCDCESWSTSEPSAEECPECEGTGVAHDGTKFDGEDYSVPCEVCNGACVLEPCGDFYRVERRDLIAAIAGKELSEYVR